LQWGDAYTGCPPRFLSFFKISSALHGFVPPPPRFQPRFTPLGVYDERKESARLQFARLHAAVAHFAEQLAVVSEELAALKSSIIASKAEEQLVTETNRRETTTKNNSHSSAETEPTSQTVQLIHKTVCDSIRRISDIVVSGTPESVTAFDCSVFLQVCESHLLAEDDCIRTGKTQTYFINFSRKHRYEAYNKQMICYLACAPRVLFTNNSMDFYWAGQHAQIFLNPLMIGLSLAVNDRRSIVVAYVDYIDAFDSVSHFKLLMKLSPDGIEGNLLSWVKAILVNHSQQTRADSKLFITSRGGGGGGDPGQCSRPTLISFAYK
jgi:hypothetical protein